LSILAHDADGARQETCMAKMKNAGSYGRSPRRGQPRLSGASVQAAERCVASTGTRGDGIVAVQAVESVLRIRSGSRVPPGEI
jgi:hypothetical protein